MTAPLTIESQRPCELQAARLPECLRCLIAIRSARHFQANNCYRRGGHQQYRCQALVQRTGSGTSQDSDDGKIGSDAGRGVSYLGRASSQGRPLSHRVVAISALTGLHCETKLHSTEADGVPILQCKRDVVAVRKRSSRGKGFKQRRRHRHKRRNQVLSRARQATWQGVDTAQGSPDNVNRLGAAVEGSQSIPPPLLEHLFPHAQLVCPPPPFFRNLFIPSCGSAT